MKLVIAEKPSVAQSLARVIGATKRQDGYLEGPCRSSGPAFRADRSGDRLSCQLVCRSPGGALMRRGSRVGCLRT